jgi:hypothetical protein
MTTYYTTTQEFECAYCGIHKVVSNAEDMDFYRCEYCENWLCYDCNEKHPKTGYSDCWAWFKALVAVFLFCFIGCSNVRHYVPKPDEPEPCENLKYPQRQPYPWELNRIDKLKSEGRCADLEKYLKNLSGD